MTLQKDGLRRAVYDSLDSIARCGEASPGGAIKAAALLRLFVLPGVTVLDSSHVRGLRGSVSPHRRPGKPGLRYSHERSEDFDAVRLCSRALKRPKGLPAVAGSARWASLRTRLTPGLQATEGVRTVSLRPAGAFP